MRHSSLLSQKYFFFLRKLSSLSQIFVEKKLKEKNLLLWPTDVSHLINFCCFFEQHYSSFRQLLTCVNFNEKRKRNFFGKSKIKVSYINFFF